MSLPQFIIIALVATLVTPPAVLILPRARQSAVFDRLLWIGTWLLAFCGAWLALGYAREYPNLPAVTVAVVAGVPVLPLLAGAALGALFINFSLWVVDRVARGTAPQEEWFEEEDLDQDEE